MKALCARGVSVTLGRRPSKSCRILQLNKYKFQTICTFQKASPLYQSVTYRSLSTTQALRINPETTESPKAQSTIDEEEIDKFRALAEQWWDEVGEFQALHTMNELRVPLIRDAVLQGRGGDGDQMRPSPLTGTLILDVGCGGGILAEPLARLGATVIGVDATEENIPIAQTHVSHDPEIRPRIKYIHGTAEDLTLTEADMFDVVVASEVVEHVSDVGQFVSTCVELVKPGGSVIFTTINKTWASYWIAVVGAEDIFRVVPHGTHNWEKFVTPEKLQALLEQCGCKVESIEGMIYNPLTHRWSWSDIQTCNYAIHAIKPGKGTTRNNTDADEEEIEVNDSTNQKT